MQQQDYSWEGLPALLSVRDVVKLTGLSRATVYALVHATDFPSFRVGQRVLVSRDGFKRWIEQQVQKHNKNR